MRIEFHPGARDDFDEAFDWYAQRNPEAASKFTADLDSTLSRIARSPEQSARYDQQHRRCLLKRFPFHVIYRVEAESIQVIAVAHGARKPRYWSNR